MASLLTLFKRKPRVFALEPLPEYRGDGAVRGREVAIWRPPVLLDVNGRSMAGVSKALVADYLVATTSALAQSDLGPVTVTWKEQEGRFATVMMDIHAWGQSVTIMHPISLISQELADAMQHYTAGMANKVRQLHKGHQNLDEANRQIRQCMRRVERLRDDDRPHFNDAEYLFVMAQLNRALTLTALIPVSETPAEDVFNATTQIQ
jgi:hypothetical protein